MCDGTPITIKINKSRQHLKVLTNADLTDDFGSLSLATLIKFKKRSNI